MSALVLAATWIGLGVVGAAGSLVIGRSRINALIPLAMAAAAAVAAARSGGWHGPLAADGTAALLLGRLPAGMLALGALSLACTRALSAQRADGDIFLVATVGGAAVVVASATEPLVWGIALMVAMGVLGLRWITAAPGRATMAAARIGGTAAAAALFVAAFYPVPAQSGHTWPELVGWLVAGALVALLGLVPLGGWAVASLRAVRGADGALWLVFVLPAILLSAIPIPDSLPLVSAPIVRGVLLTTGLGSAIWGALWASMGDREDRFIRIALADVGLAAAAIGGIGTTRAPAVALLLMGLIVATPLLGSHATSLSRWSRLSAWALLSGLPPSISFWGRLLVIQTCVASSGVAVAAALIASLTITTVTTFEMLSTAHAAPERHRGSRAVAAVVALTGIAISVAPPLAARLVLGGF